MEEEIAALEVEIATAAEAEATPKTEVMEAKDKVKVHVKAKDNAAKDRVKAKVNVVATAVNEDKDSVLKVRDKVRMVIAVAVQKLGGLRVVIVVLLVSVRAADNGRGTTTTMEDVDIADTKAREATEALKVRFRSSTRCIYD